MARRRDDEDLVGDDEGRGGDGRRLNKSDNSGADAHGVARDQLRAIIERIERLEEEKATTADDIKDVYGEAKGAGFDTKTIRQIVKIRKQDKDERMEQEAILNTYLQALGMALLGED